MKSGSVTSNYRLFNDIYSSSKNLDLSEQKIPERSTFADHFGTYTTIIENFELTEKIPSKDPSVWGPHAWKFFHIMAENYPQKPCILVQKRAKQFITSLPFMLPCENCSVHAMAFIDEREGNMDKIVSSRDDLALFFIDFHNYVNARYGKKVYSEKDEIQKIRALYK